MNLNKHILLLCVGNETDDCHVSVKYVAKQDWFWGQSKTTM